MRVRNPVVIHWVTDMDRALAFYKGVFDVPSTTESPAFSVLDLGPVKLALHGLEPGEVEGPLPNAGLNLEVDRIEDLVAMVEARGGMLVQIREPAPPVPLRVAMLRDPDGNAFELRQLP